MEAAQHHHQKLSLYSLDLLHPFFSVLFFALIQSALSQMTFVILNSKLWIRKSLEMSNVTWISMSELNDTRPICWLLKIQLKISKNQCHFIILLTFDYFLKDNLLLTLYLLRYRRSYWGCFQGPKTWPLSQVLATMLVFGGS